MSFLPEEVAAKVQQTARISIATSSKTVKDAMPVILQKVTFTSTSELKQVQRSDDQEVVSVKGSLPKSASTTTVRKQESATDRKYSTSITSIGGAVMRSKTADIERMLSKETVQPQVQDDKKKISKRRYTDSRHQTKHIPDTETLQKASAAGESGAVVHPQKGSVWKRRELIASDPKNHESTV